MSPYEFLELFKRDEPCKIESMDKESLNPDDFYVWRGQDELDKILDEINQKEQTTHDNN